MSNEQAPVIRLRKPYRAYVVIEFDVPAYDRGGAILPLEEAAQVARAAIQDACGELLEAMGIIAKDHYMEWDITAEARHSSSRKDWHERATK